VVGVDGTAWSNTTTWDSSKCLTRACRSWRLKAGVIVAIWVRKGDRLLSNGKFESRNGGTHELVFAFHDGESRECW